MNNEPLLLSIKQAAELVGLSVKTIRRYSGDGRFPSPVRAGRLIKFRREELIQWVAHMKPISGGVR